MEHLLDEIEARSDRRGKTPWVPIVGSILLHIAILWWLTGKLEAGLPQIQTPFVVDLMEEKVGEKTDVQSEQSPADLIENEEETPVSPLEEESALEEPPTTQEEQPAPQEEQPVAQEERLTPQEETSAPAPVLVTENANPQDLSGEEEIQPAPDDVLPERNEDILNALQKELFSRSLPVVEVPHGRTYTPIGGSKGAPGALGSSAGISGPLGQRTLHHLELPEYPAWARRQGIEASVRFRFWVSPEGDVIRIETIHRSGYPELESLGREALLHWRFAPLSQGEFQEEWGEVPILWRLSGSGGGGVVTQEEP